MNQRRSLAPGPRPKGAVDSTDTGRQLFQASRTRKTSSNDADRLRKYLARFGLSYDEVRENG